VQLSTGQEEEEEEEEELTPKAEIWSLP